MKGWKMNETKIEKIEDMSLEKISGVYSVLTSLCEDYSRMTDNYSLATGDSLFESMPSDILKMVANRQKFFGYRERIKEILLNKIDKLMSGDE